MEPEPDLPADRRDDGGTADRREPVLAFRDGVAIEIAGDAVSVTSPLSSFTLRPVREATRDALSRLAAGPTPVPALLAGLPAAERAPFSRFLQRAGHLLARSVYAGGQEMLRIEHTAPDARDDRAELSAPTPVRLSRFALCRTRDGGLVLESPLARSRVRLVHRAARELVAALGTPAPAAALAGELPVADVVELVGHLAGGGFVDLGDADGRFGADADPTLRQWEFHDLLFHSRTRAGRYDDPLGGNYPYAGGGIDPQPAVKEPPAGPSVPLPRPALDEVLAGDPGLTVTLEGRRSVREYGEQPMTMGQLGEFLFRVARVRVHRFPGQRIAGEIVGKPYPTGGSAHELELYLTVHRCAGLDPGIYYHDPVGHRLVLVNPDPAEREAMLAVAARSTGVPVRPDVLVTITSRFQRLSWKYSGIAYGMTLRHTGVLYQTMYLVATAMGLAPCGLGIGDADLAARALKLDYLRESSVGDFALGSRPPGRWTPGRPPTGGSSSTTPSGAGTRTESCRPEGRPDPGQLRARPTASRTAYTSCSRPVSRSTGTSSRPTRPEATIRTGRTASGAAASASSTHGRAGARASTTTNASATSVP